MLELLLLLILNQNPTCTPHNLEWLQWGSSGEDKVEGPAVPPDRVWLVRAAGTSIKHDRIAPIPKAEYMLELIRPVSIQNDACCWRIPLQRSPQRAVYGTPVLALDRPITLYPGEFLASRVNGLGSWQMSLQYVYYDLPRSCLP